RSGVGERRIVAHHSEIGFADLDAAKAEGANRVVLDGDFVLAAVAIVSDRERVALRSRRGLAAHHRSRFRRTHRGPFSIRRANRASKLPQYTLHQIWRVSERVSGKSTCFERQNRAKFTRARSPNAP